MNYKKLWIGLGLVIVLSFVVLGYFGTEIYRKAPPIPEKVVTSGGDVVFTKEDIQNGQNVWQSMGGQEMGTVWGHGAYIAPDWTADWIHREAVWILNDRAEKKYGQKFDDLSPANQAELKETLKDELRKNTYNASSGTITISSERAEAVKNVGKHFTSLFSGDPKLDHLREVYAIPKNAVKDPQRLADLNAFFWWASWACVTNRPGSNITYTSNWPAEELVGNKPEGMVVVWSVISFVLLLAGIGALAWYYAASRRKQEAEHHEAPEWDPLLALAAYTLNESNS